MRVTLKFDGKSISVNAQSGFELLVDGEVLLAHEGEKTACCGGKCCDKDAGYADVGYGRETLFDNAKPETKDAYHRLQAALAQIRSSEVNNEESRPRNIIYHCKDVENSSFITRIRWWNWEEALGENALEVSLKDGRILNYADVPFHIYSIWVKTIVDGGSAGRYFNQSIKNEYELVSEIDQDGNKWDEGDDE
jgi:hypothetical protein